MDDFKTLKTIGATMNLFDKTPDDEAFDFVYKKLVEEKAAKVNGSDLIKLSTYLTRFKYEPHRLDASDPEKVLNFLSWVTGETKKLGADDENKFSVVGNNRKIPNTAT